MEWNGYLRKRFFIPRWKSGMESGTPVEREVERLKNRGQRKHSVANAPHHHPGLAPGAAGWYSFGLPPLFFVRLQSKNSHPTLSALAIKHLGNNLIQHTSCGVGIVDFQLLAGRIVSGTSGVVRKSQTCHTFWVFTDLINSTEAANLLGVSRATLFRLAAAGELDSISQTRPGLTRGARRFSRSNVLAYISRGFSEQRPRKKARLPAPDHATALREGNELRAEIAKLKKDMKRALIAGGALAHNLSRKATVDPVVLIHVATLEDLRFFYNRGTSEAQ